MSCELCSPFNVLVGVVRIHQYLFGPYMRDFDVIFTFLFCIRAVALENAHTGPLSAS